MPDTLDVMQRITRDIAAAEDAPTTERAIERAARILGLTYRRAFGFYYGTARSVSAEEWIAAQSAIQQARRLRAARLRAELVALEMSLELTNGNNLEDGCRLFHVDRRSVT
jgi:hypothetical protein